VKAGLDLPSNFVQDQTLEKQQKALAAPGSFWKSWEGAIVLLYLAGLQVFIIRRWFVNKEGCQKDIHVTVVMFANYVGR